VGGGTFNNDSFSLVHRSMAGLIGQKPRGKPDACHAILMIDPLAAEAKRIEPTGKSLVAVVKALPGSVVGAARYLTVDMELFVDEAIFSRFQLVPVQLRIGTVGEAALTGSSLFARGGWYARKFRVHDYLLGRQNMREYLRRKLVLAGDNPLFDGWDTAMRKGWAMNAAAERVADIDGMPRADYFLPIIPDCTGDALRVPDWPVGACDPADLEGILRNSSNSNLAFTPTPFRVFLGLGKTGLKQEIP
jgi:hypothetical protein